LNGQIAGDGKEKRVFVSFAMPDAGLAKAFVSFLRLGCDLADQQVFLTARPGTLPAGEQFTEAIREALTEADMAILMLSPAYYESRFCLAEAGAVWVQKKKHIPLLVPPNTYNDLEGVQLGEQALRINSSSDLDDLRDVVAVVCGKQIGTSSWNEQKTEFLNRWTSEFEDSIAKPSSVPASDLARAEARAAGFEKENTDLSDEVDRLRVFTRQLRSQNDQLRSLVPSAPAPPELEEDETAAHLAEALSALELAKARLSDLPAIAREALFLHFHDAQPLTVGGFSDGFSVEDGRRNVEAGDLKWEEDEAQVVTVRHEQPEIEEAESALEQVRDLVFDGTSYEGRARAGDWIRPLLKERFGITDPVFELRPVWESLGFI
jgi:hypothetical protein